MMPIDYEAEVAMFMAALDAYGIACAGDHTAALSHLKAGGAIMERGTAVDKGAAGVAIGLYMRALVQLREAQESLQAADAAGYARAMGEVDAACARLYDHDGGGRVVMIGQTRTRRPYQWHAWPEETYEPPAPDAPTPTAALIAATAKLTDTANEGVSDGK